MPFFSVQKMLRARKNFLTYSSCGASGLNFSLVLTPVELVLKSGILKETKHIFSNLGSLKVLLYSLRDPA